MLFQIEPQSGVGPLRLGMPINAAIAVLHTLGEPYQSCLIRHPIVTRADLTLSLLDDDNLLDGIHIEGPLHHDSCDQVRYRGIDVLLHPARQVLAELSSHTHLNEVRPGAYETADHTLYLRNLSGDLDDAFDTVGMTVFDPDW